MRSTSRTRGSSSRASSSRTRPKTSSGRKVRTASPGTSVRGTSQSAGSARKRNRTGAGSSSRRTAAARGRKGPVRRSGAVRLSTIAIVGAVVLAAWTVYPVLRIQYQAQREVQSLEAELTQLKDRNVELREQVESLKTPEGVERLARENLGLVKPGEQAYVVTGGMSAESSPTVLQGIADERSLVQRVLDAVFGFQ